MRISLIYGEDNAKAYSRFRELIDQSKSKGFQIIEIDDLKKIVNQSLFDEKVVFALRNPNKIKLTDWKWLDKNANKYNSNLLIYFEGNISALILKNLPKTAKRENFDLPKLIFLFLESFYPGNSQKTLKLLNELIENEPIELIFSILAGHIKNLYWAKVSSHTMEMPDWRILKFVKQTEKFEIKTLQKIISELARIDIKAKTSSEDLKSLLDLFIVENLQ